VDNYYDILNVKKDVSPDELKKVYRKLSMKYHPDRNSGDKTAEDKFKKINEAYSVLSDPAKRHSYDNPAPNFGGGMNPFGDILRNMNVMRKKPDPNSPRGGTPLKYLLHVPISKFILGGEVEFEKSYKDVCVDCGGNGSKTTENCSNCGGTGMIQEIKTGQGIQSMITRPCMKCSGLGFISKRDCISCSGSGAIEIKNRKLSFTVNPGCRDGEVIVVKGKGGKGVNGGPDGDLFVKVTMVIPDVKNLSEEQINLLKEI
jgi:molecular chaperone DnaJ